LEDDVDLPGFGRRDKDAVKDARSALERAGDAPEDDGVLGRQVLKVVESLLDLGIDGKGTFAPAAKVADDALRSAGGDVDKAIDAVIRSHTLKAGAEGFVTSLGGFVTLPVSLPANVIAFYALATRMTAAIARLRGHDIAQPQVRTAVLLSLAGAEADDLLRKAGKAVPAGGITNLVAQRLPGPAEMVVKKAVGFRVIATAGKGTFARFGRAVPVLGGAVGAGVDVWMLRSIATNARKEFPPADRLVGPA
jgi:hypothetical protein